jgi:hypothetical protein
MDRLNGQNGHGIRQNGHKCTDYVTSPMSRDIASRDAPTMSPPPLILKSNLQIQTINRSGKQKFHEQCNVEQSSALFGYTNNTNH